MITMFSNLSGILMNNQNKAGISLNTFFATTSGINKKICCYTKYLVIFIALVLLFSCQSSTKKSEGLNKKDSSALFISLPQPLPLSHAEAARLSAACLRWYDSALLPRGFNGGMLVAKNGNIIFEKYNGTGHLRGKDGITANTPMQIASVSKTFTAMGVLKLWQDGKLNIDNELSTYLKKFNYPGVTIRSLLNHRSGLPNYLYFMQKLGWDEKITVTNQDVLTYLVEKKGAIENIAPPDKRFTYCNTNYALLALLIEAVSGKKYPEFMQETFFMPLQMKNTFVFTGADSGKINLSYDWRGRLIPLNYLDAVYGDKNIYTTPQDLLIWDRALNSNKIFTAETLAQAYTPYSNEKPGIKNYGLGWRMNIYPDGKKMIFHNGWWHGSNAVFIRLLAENATIIVIGNKFTSAIYHAKDLCNLFNNYYGNDEDEENETIAPQLYNNGFSIPAAPDTKKDVRLQNILKEKKH